MTGTVLIMTKAPRPGEVKTRLEPLLGPAGCVRLQTELIRHTVGWAQKAASQTWLAYAPADAGAQMAALLPAGIRMLAQAGADLGARLTDASARVLTSGSAPLFVIGSDAPLLGPAHVAAARDALVAGHDVALVPALDGGYGLIALARNEPDAFSIPPDAWGGPDVLKLTLAALRRARLSAALLEPVGDLDTPADARALAAHPDCPPLIRRALHPAARAAA